MFKILYQYLKIFSCSKKRTLFFWSVKVINSHKIPFFHADVCSWRLKFGYILHSVQTKFIYPFNLCQLFLQLAT